MATFESMGAKEICIFVVSDDIVCQNIVSTMLQYCGHYEVLNSERIKDASSIIRERKDRIQLVLTNVQKSSTDGSKILLQIEREFKIPLLPITPYDKGSQVSTSRVGSSPAAKLCFLKSINMDEFKRVWQHAYAIEKRSNIILSSSTLRPDCLNESINNNALTSVPNQKKWAEKQTTETFDQESNDMIDETSSMEKKQRFVWTKRMHLKFVEAICHLGPEKAVPKKIVEWMNIPGLTRENVASHLQKYRMNKKRDEERLHPINPISRISQTNYHHHHEDETEYQPLFQQNHSSFEQTMLYRCTNQCLDVDDGALDFIQVDESVSSATLSMGKKNVEEPGSSYVGFRLTDNGKFVANEMQMNNISFGSESALEMVNEMISEEGSIFFPCNPESSIDNPYFVNLQNQPPLQENTVLDLDNLGVEVGMDDLFIKSDTGETSINPTEFMGDCFFDDFDNYTFSL